MKLVINQREIGTIEGYHQHGDIGNVAWTFNLEEGFSVTVPCNSIRDWESPARTGNHEILLNA